MQSKLNEKYFFFGLLLLVAIFAFFIFRPFFIVIILAASLSVVLAPLYSFLLRKVTRGWKWPAALLTVLAFIIILCGPLFGIGTLVYHQSQGLYTSLATEGGANPFIANLSASINEVLPGTVSFDLQDKIADVATFLTQNITRIFTATLGTVLSLFLTILSLFYFLKDGTHWRKLLIDLSPLSDKYDEGIIARLHLTINSVVKGYLLVAVIQGVLMGTGLWIFGIPNPALWGVIAGLGSLVPMVGTGLVWIPSVIFLFATGSHAQAIGLLAWSAIIVGAVDNILTPYFVGKGVAVPSLVILFAVLGGIALLGPAGILIGPLTVSLLHTLLSMYRTDFRSS